jgi:hypothetical protein
MTTSLIKGLPWAVFLLTGASGCEFIDFDAPGEVPPGDLTPVDGAAPPGAAPFYPFRPGSIWQYIVTGLDGSKSVKYVAIDKSPVMVGGNGEHQLDMAYAVNTSSTLGGVPWLSTLQQQVGNKVVNWREQRFDQLHQLAVDTSWDPEQLEIDQSVERTRTGASWQENYTEMIRPSGFPVQTVKHNATWKVVGQEMLTLPEIAQPFQTLVYQKTIGMGGTGGNVDGGMPPVDAGPVSDAGTGRPMLTSGISPEDGGTVGDGGTVMPKTIWWARGYGKVKEAGGGEPMEELRGLELH